MEALWSHFENVMAKDTEGQAGGEQEDEGIVHKEDRDPQ